MNTQPKINEYDQQAIDFLASTNTTLTVEYSHTDKYFSNDTEKRDIYRFTLKNDKGEYSALFGDSAHNTLYNQYVTGKKPLNYKNDFDFCKANKIPVAMQRVRMGLKRKEPGAYDILACMDSYVPDTFEEFCEEYCYNELPLSEHDSVMKIYLDCKEQARGLRRLFTTPELEQLSEIA